jgi:uncharacterized metal-binding protein
MPSGRTHDRITLWTLPLVGGLTLAVTRNSLPTLMICAGYLFGGLMLGPDLDLHSVQYKRWGWFRWIWLPYQWSINHRSPYSHAPIIGTTLRIIYLLAWMALATFLVMAALNDWLQVGFTWSQVEVVVMRLWRSYQAEAIALFIGLEFGAFSHYTADWLVSSLKQKQPRRKKK